MNGWLLRAAGAEKQCVPAALRGCFLGGPSTSPLDVGGESVLVLVPEIRHAAHQNGHGHFNRCALFLRRRRRGASARL